MLYLLLCMLCLLLPLDLLWLGLLCMLCTLSLLPVGFLLLCLLLVKRLRLLNGKFRVTVAFTVLLITVGSQVSQPA